jgi:hypothetical protein
MCESGERKLTDLFYNELRKFQRSNNATIIKEILGSELGAPAPPLMLASSLPSRIIIAPSKLA